MVNLPGTQEKGVFDALRYHLLQTLQFFVVKTSDGSHDLLETYTFTFRYMDGHLDTIVFEPSKYMLTIKTLCQGFKGAIRALLRSLKDLPRLPGQSVPFDKQ